MSSSYVARSFVRTTTLTLTMSGQKKFTQIRLQSTIDEYPSVMALRHFEKDILAKQHWEQKKKGNGHWL